MSEKENRNNNQNREFQQPPRPVIISQPVVAMPQNSHQVNIVYQVPPNNQRPIPRVIIREPHIASIRHNDIGVANTILVLILNIFPLIGSFIYPFFKMRSTHFGHVTYCSEVCKKYYIIAIVYFIVFWGNRNT